jgi:hypothetical protein
MHFSGTPGVYHLECLHFSQDPKDTFDNLSRFTRRDRLGRMDDTVPSPGPFIDTRPVVAGDYAMFDSAIDQ